MEKLFEIRIHILRIVYQGASNGQQGEVSRHYITTVSKRISVR